MQLSPLPKAYPVDGACALLQSLYALIQDLELKQSQVVKNKGLMRERQQGLQGMLNVGMSPHNDQVVKMRTFIQKLQDFAVKTPKGIRERTIPLIGM